MSDDDNPKNRSATGFQPVSFKLSNASGFKPIGPDLQITERNLPHWQRGGATYFLTFNAKNFWFDHDEQRIVFDACRHWAGKKFDPHALVVMPNHVHMIITPRAKSEQEFCSLGEIVHSIKRHSSREINQRRGRSGPLWWDEYYDRLVRDEREYRQKLRYLKENPERKGLVARGEEYEFYWEEKKFK
jgi:putative transposase